MALCWCSYKTLTTLIAAKGLQTKTRPGSLLVLIHEIKYDLQMPIKYAKWVLSTIVRPSIQ